MIVHLLEFRVTPGHEAEVVGFIRHSGPADSASAGILMQCLGRRLSRHQQEHIAVTSWRDEAALAHGTDPFGMPVYLSPRADLLGDRKLSSFRVSAALGDGVEGARVLRVYRANVAAADVAEWARRAVEHLAGLVGTEGLVYVREGVGMAGANPEGDVPVLALSCWRDWDAVLAATGGHIDRLVQSTELVDLERFIGVDHYELLASD